MRLSEFRGTVGGADPFSDGEMNRRANMIWRTGAIRDVRADVDRDAWRKAMRAIKQARTTVRGEMLSGAGPAHQSVADLAPHIDDILVLNRLAQ